MATDMPSIEGDVGSKATYRQAVHRNPRHCQFGHHFAAPRTYSEPSYAVCINRLSPEAPKVRTGSED
jgi:hypothetical protein